MSNRANLANGITATAVNTSSTTVALQTGYVAGMPPTPFYATITPFGQLPTMGNSEIVQVVAVAGDNLMVIRAQKGTTAKSFAAGAVVTNSVYTDDKIGADNIDWSTVNYTDGEQIGSATVGSKNKKLHSKFIELYINFTQYSFIKIPHHIEKPFTVLSINGSVALGQEPQFVSLTYTEPSHSLRWGYDDTDVWFIPTHSWGVKKTRVFIMYTQD